MECKDLLYGMNSKPVTLASNVSFPSKWVVPPPGWVKANIDGTVRLLDSDAAYDGLIRDEDGLIGKFEFIRSPGIAIELRIF
ncbi:hypothetical protein V6N12_060206 [Hibiscus sabdariffa]|uniref:Uncharacterized protein n=1 Tax=Hibiscus sabdariffa TaxID=183260 RepID=A0ABR2D3Q7_9ROSI